MSAEYLANWLKAEMSGLHCYGQPIQCVRRNLATRSDVRVLVAVEVVDCDPPDIGMTEPGAEELDADDKYQELAAMAEVLEVAVRLHDDAEKLVIRSAELSDMLRAKHG